MTSHQLRQQTLTHSTTVCKASSAQSFTISTMQTPEHIPSNLSSDAAPTTVTEAEELLINAALTNEHCKKALKVLKVIGAHNAKRATKLKVIAIKMVQRAVKLQDLREVIANGSADSGTHLEPLSSMMTSTVELTRQPDGSENVECERGDCPVFTDEGIDIGMPQRHERGNSSTLSESRTSPFQASEYCRLLHELADPRMISASQKLMERMTRAELDHQHEDPWCEGIALLFNDVDFNPERILVLAGGVSSSDIDAINPAMRPFCREGGFLKRKFAAFKSEYGSCVARYEASGQSDPDAFVTFGNGRSYILYAFCFLHVHPLMKPFATRPLSSDAQRKEGVDNGVSPFGFGGNEGSRATSARYGVRDVNVIRMDSLVTALRCRDHIHAKEVEDAELRRLELELFDAYARHKTSAMEALTRTMKMLESAKTDEDRALFENLLRQLKSARCAQICETVSVEDAVQFQPQVVQEQATASVPLSVNTM